MDPACQLLDGGKNGDCKTFNGHVVARKREMDKILGHELSRRMGIYCFKRCALLQLEMFEKDAVKTGEKSAA